MAAATVLGAALQALAATRGLFGDELFTYDIARRAALGDVVDGVLATEVNPPAYYLLAWLTGKVLSAPEWARLPALIAGVGLVPLCSALAWRVFGQRAAIVCAVLVAVSPFVVYYGSEARSYAPAALCVASSTWFLLSALDRPSRWRWAALGISAAGAMWLHYFAALPLAAQAAWALLSQPACRRALLAAHAGAAALYLPWLPYVSEPTPREITSAFNPTSAADRAGVLIRPLVGDANRPLDDVPGVLPAAVACLVLAAVAALAVRSAHARLQPSDPRALLAACVLVTPAAILALAALGDNAFNPRYLIVSLPAALVLLSGLIARRPAPVAVAATIAVVAVLGSTSLRTAFGDLRRPAYDEAAAIIDRSAGPQDPVIELPLVSIAGDGAWRTALSIFLDEPHPLFQADDRSAEGGWEAAERRGVAFVLYPDTPLLDPPRPPAGSSLEPVRRRSWSGTSELTLVEYRSP